MRPRLKVQISPGDDANEHARPKRLVATDSVGPASYYPAGLLRLVVRIIRTATAASCAARASWNQAGGAVFLPRARVDFTLDAI
jgi:hypothetical protein